MCAAALERLAAEDICDASEKAWCAAKRVTDALIVARTSKELPRSNDTTRALDALANRDPNVKILVGLHPGRREAGR